MTYEQALMQEQINREIQDSIRYQYRIGGESDGYDGVFSQENCYEYLVGYCMGVYKYRLEQVEKKVIETDVPF